MVVFTGFYIRQPDQVSKTNPCELNRNPVITTMPLCMYYINIDLAINDKG